MTRHWDPEATMRPLRNAVDSSGEHDWRHLVMEGIGHISEEMTELQKEVTNLRIGTSHPVTQAVVVDIVTTAMGVLNERIRNLWIFFVAGAGGFGAVIGFIAARVFK